MHIGEIIITCTVYVYNKYIGMNCYTYIYGIPDEEEGIFMFQGEANLLRNMGMKYE